MAGEHEAQPRDGVRDYLLRCARGEIRTELGLQEVRTSRIVVEHNPGQYPDLEEALRKGDRKFPDDPRWPTEPPPSPTEIPVEPDPATEAELDRLLEQHAPEDNGHTRKRADGGRPASLADRLRGAIIDTATIRNIPPPDPLIDAYLIRDSLAVLYGPSGAGKTFLALDWALHVATATWWQKREVHAGPVLYITAEGTAGVGRRIDAWCEHNRTHDLGRHHPVHWLPQAVNLADATEVAALAGIATDLQPVLVVVDTLARCTLGAEENSAKDMGVVVANLDRLRRATGACVLAVHHTGKDHTAGGRGSSALKAALDTELELTAADDRLTLKVTKQKDSPEPMPLRLARVAAADSCALIAAAQLQTDDELPAGVTETLDALRTVALEGGATTKVWRGQADVPERTFYRHLKRLAGAGLVINRGTDAQPRWAPADQDEHD